MFTYVLYVTMNEMKERRLKMRHTDKFYLDVCFPYPHFLSLHLPIFV